MYLLLYIVVHYYHAFKWTYTVQIYTGHLPAEVHITMDSSADEDFAETSDKEAAQINWSDEDTKGRYQCLFFFCIIMNESSYVSNICLSRRSWNMGDSDQG